MRMQSLSNRAPTRHEMASISNTILPADSILLSPRYHGAVVRCAFEAEQGARKQLALCWLAAARGAASYRSLSMRQGGSGRECGGFLKAVVVVVVVVVVVGVVVVGSVKSSQTTSAPVKLFASR